MNDLEKSIKLFFFALLVGVLVYFTLTDPSYATGDCKGHSCNDSGGDVVVGVNADVTTNLNSTLSSTMNGGDLVGGDTNVSTGGNRALALSNNMGDVDIADCLGSTQFGTPLFSKQKLVINNVCLAQFYMQMGKHDLAAMALCNIPGILKEFESEEECEYAHDFAPVLEEVVIVADYEDEWREEQMQMQLDYEARIEKLEKKVNRPRVVQETVVEQKPWMTEEKRAALQAILDEDEE